MDDDTNRVEDDREVELSSISAIFPELVLDATDPFSASIDLPVAPSLALPIIFPALPDNETGDEVEPEVHHLNYLPSLHLQVSLPEGYPAKNPPIFEISTTPQWLSQKILDKLAEDGERLWEELGRDQVLYSYIDHVQQATENVFGVLDNSEYLKICPDYKIALLDYDIKSKKAAFDRETFDCGVCLDPKKGSTCHRMVDCGHIFCVQCLQDFYNNAITEGDITSVKCLAPDCAKTRLAGGKSSRRKRKANISPSELLQIPIHHDVVKRYVDLKRKVELESDKNTIYCPRKWCQGAARTRKHRKPENWEDGSDDGSDDDEEVHSDGKNFDASTELLVVCEDCSFAFCRRCYQGWHGDFSLCVPRTNTGELTEEDKASLEYLKLHTTPCPTCAAPAQKTHGCNHMICFRCNTHFCYLCSAWLEPGNPYQHYNQQKLGCYQRLWELEGGDGDDVGYGFGGGDNFSDGEADFDTEDEEDEVEHVDHVGEVLDQNQPPAAIEPPAVYNPQMAQPVREGPLVLRIDQLPPRPIVPPQQAARPAQRGAYGGRQIGRRHAAAIAARHANEHPRRGGANGRGRGRPIQPPAMVAPQQVVAVVPPAPAPAPARQDVGRDLPPEQADHDRAWVQRFVQMALNDEEDQLQWDSDEEDGNAWDIPDR